MLTAAALGKPWLQPKKVSTAGGKATEACPGKPATDVVAPPRAQVTASFTKGGQPGASIGRFSVATLSEDGAAKYRAAWVQTVKACAAFKDAAGLYVVTTPEGPRNVVGAEELLSRVERVYYDSGHKQLAYARHFLSARTGRTVSTVEYDFLTTKADPNAKDFGPVTKLLDLQLARTRSAFQA